MPISANLRPESARGMGFALRWHYLYVTVWNLNVWR